MTIRAIATYSLQAGEAARDYTHAAGKDRPRKATGGSMRLFAIIVTAVLILLLWAGCETGRRGTGPLTIEVISVDGVPLTGIRVTMRDVATGRTARGVCDQHGQCQMGTFTANDGVVFGTHQVALSNVVVPRDEITTNTVPNRPRIAWRYASFDRSGIVLEVTPASERLVTIRVERE